MPDIYTWIYPEYDLSLYDGGEQRPSPNSFYSKPCSFFFFLSFRHPADGRAQQGENLHVQNPFFLRDCQNKMLPGKGSGKKCLAWHWRGHEEFFCPQPLLLFQNERAFNGIVWRADWKSWWRITHQHAYTVEECSQTFSEARNFKKKNIRARMIEK